MAFVEGFLSTIDESRVRTVFPEMTDSEVPFWVGSPCFFSMVGHYALAMVVLGIHLMFFWAAEGERVVGDGGLMSAIGYIKWALDVAGVLGFIVTMFLVAKINHYLNFSTSGKWTTSWLILNGAIPLLMVLADVSGEVFHAYTDGSSFGFPGWLQTYYLALGVFSSGSMVALTVLYQRAFRYAITDRRIHIRKRFLYFDTSAHGIAFNNIENLKVEPSIIGRILGFGNLHVVTASGIGLREDETGIGAGLAADVDSMMPERRGLVRSVFGWVSAQRQRTTVDQNPEDCLYGVRDPISLYRLINELIDAR